MAIKATLMVDPATGALSAPVLAAAFRTANTLQTQNAKLDTLVTIVSWSGSTMVLTGGITSNGGITATGSIEASNGALISGGDITSVGDLLVGGIITANGVAVPTISSTSTLTNKTINGSNNTITNVSLTTGITGILGYANGGTAGATQSAARSNIGGTRTENPNSGTGDSTATPPSFNGDFTGQIATTNYNRQWWWNGTVWRSEAFYSGVFTCDGLKTLTGDNTHTFVIGTATQEIDNVLTLQNKHNARHSAMRFLGIDGGEKGAMGYGNPGALAFFADANYSECFSTQNWNFVGASPKRVCFRLEGSTGDLVVLSDDGSSALARFDQSADLLLLPGVSSENGRLDLGDENFGIAGRVNNTTGYGFHYHAFGGSYTLPVGHRFFTGGLRASQTLKLSITDDLVNCAIPLFTPSISLGKTITAAGTTGARTINQATGMVNFAAAATSLVVTNSLAVAPTSGTTGSIIIGCVNSNDTTMKSVQCVCTSNGSFTIYPNAAPTAECKASFRLTN